MLLNYLILLVFTGTCFVSAKPTVYLIRHAEKPAHGNGLSHRGHKRTQCLRTVFGAGSEYKIGHIMAPTPQRDGTQQRSYLTVLPLAHDLGFPIDTSCSRDDASCVADAILSHTGPGNVLIAWEHKRLRDIVLAINNASDPRSYPHESYDLIWTLHDDYSVVSITGQKCPHLDFGLFDNESQNDGIPSDSDDWKAWENLDL